MPRAGLFGYIAVLISLSLAGIFFYHTFYTINYDNLRLDELNGFSYYILTAPIGLTLFIFLCTGLWVGWTILTIKVAPPMPEIVEKKDFARLKAMLLCLASITLALIFIYGVYIRSYWALAIPAAAITLVILGMVFWVGIAIITARTTLPGDKKEQNGK